VERKLDPSKDVFNFYISQLCIWIEQPGPGCKTIALIIRMIMSLSFSIEIQKGYQISVGIGWMS
jgi:hypothetical protein